MTTARYRPTWELAVDPLVSCKLCLGEFPLEQMTTITQCQCVFCTLVSRTLYKQQQSSSSYQKDDDLSKKKKDPPNKFIQYTKRMSSLFTMHFKEQ